MNQRENKPSRIALILFYWFCHPDFREEIEGDLIERFNNYSLKYGHKKANRLFIATALSGITLTTTRRSRITQP